MADSPADGLADCPADCLVSNISDVQGLVKPPRVKGKGQEGKGQGKDFMTLNKPLTSEGSRVYRGFTGVLQGFLLL